jgi:hypothetical protein
MASLAGNASPEQRQMHQLPPICAARLTRSETTRLSTAMPLRNGA